MIRPEKEDYDLNDYFEAVKLCSDLIKYIDYLEIEKPPIREQKLPIDLVSKSVCITNNCPHNNINECSRFDLYKTCRYKTVC